MKYQEPERRVLNKSFLQDWFNSPAYKEYFEFINILSLGVKGKKISQLSEPSIASLQKIIIF